MKQTLLCFLFSTICSTLFSQFSKNTKMAGSNFSFHHSRNKQDSIFSGGVDLQIGKTISTNLFAGITMNAYGPIKKSLTGNSQFGGGLFLRKYFPIGKSFYIFANSNLSYQKSVNKVNSHNFQSIETLHNHAISLGLHPGLSYQINKNILIELAFNQVFYAGYNQNQWIYTTPLASGISTRKSFQVRSNLSLSDFLNPTLGFRIIF